MQILSLLFGNALYVSSRCYRYGLLSLHCPLFCVGDLYTEAAEAAMEAMKGRLANQYYQKAEEAWAAMEE